MWVYSRGEMPLPALRLWLAGGALSDDDAPAPIITRDDADTLCRCTWRFMLRPRLLILVASDAANPEASDGGGGSPGSAPSAESAPHASKRSRRLARRNALRELQAPKPNHVGPAALVTCDAALPSYPQAAQPECESVGHRAPSCTAAADARAPGPLAPAPKKSRGEAGPVTRAAAQADESAPVTAHLRQNERPKAQSGTADPSERGGHSAAAAPVLLNSEGVVSHPHLKSHAAARPTRPMVTRDGPPSTMLRPPRESTSDASTQTKALAEG